VEIHCRRDETQQWVIEFIDTGKPFNLLSLPSPDLTVDLEHRQIGGLGVPLIRAMVDTLTYRRDSDRNILRLGVQQRYDTP
jgi:anti-sigma regulatory factor (Ser/Thr protein kinase)